MDGLTIEQLKNIPWNRYYVSGPDAPPEPEPKDIPELINRPFIKRNKEYDLFYTWLEIIRCVDKERKLKILDAACGRGQICQVLSYYGHDVTGADIIDCYGADKRTSRFVQYDLNKMFPFSNDTFDVVINSTALHYLDSSEHFFSEANRILKKEGMIVFSMPNISNIAGRFYFLKTGKISEYSSAILSRKNFLYPEYIYRLIENKGFKLIKIVGVTPLISNKIKIFNTFFGRWMFDKEQEKIKYSKTIIIAGSKI